MLKAYYELIRLHKPTGFLLLLAPTILTMVANQEDLWVPETVIILLGAFIGRSLGCVLNDVCDVKIDAQVKRTQSRPLVQGTLSKQQAFIFFLILSMVGLFLISLLPHRSYPLFMITILMILTYPLSKRWFILPQLHLGLTFSMPVFIVSSIYYHELTMLSYILFTLMVIWVFAFDTIYALADYQDDLNLPIHTSVKTIGPEKSKKIIKSLLWIVHIGMIYLAFQKHNLAFFEVVGFSLATSLIFLNNYLLSKISEQSQGWMFLFHLQTLLGASWVIMLW
jgi:4-hydroxybenzoate polyprenyltransferase